jgi:hypothetical protein
LLGGSLAVGASCHRHQGEAAADALPAESVVHGIVSVTGTGFEQQVVLQRTSLGGSLRLHASPADSAALVRVGGAEVAARGELTGRSLRVRSFTVTRVGNAPVVDGVLRMDGSRLLLDSTNGAVTLGNPPQALRNAIGARVWVSGPLDTGPNSFGMIQPKAGGPGAP